MEEEDLINKNFTLTLEDSIEILTTDDDRLKIIGEEISNETGRAVLSKLFEGVTSISTIASSLGVSMQLVGWHIQRLSDVGLISINRVEQSSKNKQIHHYGPKKIALIIVPSSVAKSPLYLNAFKNALKKMHDKIPAFVLSIVGGLSLYILQDILNPVKVVLVDSDKSSSFSIDYGLVVSIIGAFGVGLMVWQLTKWKQKRQKMTK